MDEWDEGVLDCTYCESDAMVERRVRSLERYGDLSPRRSAPRDPWTA